MVMHLDAKRNEYADILGRLLDEIPKAVIAAIAVSVITQGGDRLDGVKDLILKEWETLHANGIVPQKVSAKARRFAKE